MTEPIKRIVMEAAGYLPSLIAAAVLLLLGWATAHILRAVCRRVVKYVLERTRRIAFLRARLEQETMYQSLPKVVGALVYWLVLLLFVTAAVEALGLQVVSDVFSAAAVYLPHILAAVVVLFVGWLIGDWARHGTATWASRAGLAHPDTLARVVQVIVVILAALIAIEQLGLDSTGVLIAMTVIGGSVAIAAALALGLGTRSMVENMVAAHHVQKTYDVGDTVEIANHRGRIAEISRTDVTLATTEGRARIPASQFIGQVAIVISPGE